MEVTVKMDKGEGVEVRYSNFQRGFDLVNRRVLTRKLKVFRWALR